MASRPPKADESAHASHPGIYDRIGVGYARLRRPDPRIARQIHTALGGARIERVPVPHDCTDGFQAAYWRRPECYLDPRVRASISTLAQIPDTDLAPGIARLEADLASGAWAERHADLLGREEMDFGYRLLVSG